jgi:hypothetical protein
MSKDSHDTRIDRLERENADLKRRIALIEFYLDPGRVGLTVDAIRDAWRRDAGIERPTAPEFGAV